MSDPPPPKLVELLGRFGLATAEQVRGMRGRARRLAHGLPVFESVWVDALAQARLLTAFQAVEFNEGRAEGLEVGPFVLYQPLPSPGYAKVFRAREIAASRWMRLTRFEVPADRAGEARRQLDLLVRRGELLTHESVVPVLTHGATGGGLWAASRDQRGTTALEWMVEQGRFPPQTVLEIARQMAAALAVCDEAGVVHGDVAAGQLLLDPLGAVHLAEPGLRGIARPVEGFAHADLPPGDFDYLPPERVASGGLPDAAGDLFAAGCLWWHLLAGRPPIPGGTGLMKLRAGQTARISDIRQLAPDVSEVLATAIDRCTQANPQRRPASAAQLAAELGQPNPTGHARLAQCMGRSAPRRTRAVLTAAAWRRRGSNATVLAAAAGTALALGVATWPQWGAKWFQATSRATLDDPTKNPSVALARERPTAKRTANSPSREPAIGDPQVVRATHVVDAHDTVDDDAQDIVELPTGRPLKLDTLRLAAAQTVRGQAGRRPRVIVPSHGLTIAADDVRFENIDFVWDHPRAAPVAGRRDATTAGRESALLRLEAPRATFRGCSFQARARFRPTQGALPLAIQWHGNDETTVGGPGLPTGELELTDCVLAGVSAGIAVQGEGALFFELTNVLHLGPGPLVELRRPRRLDEPFALTLAHVTLRGSAGLVACHYERLEEQPGRLAIRATDCAFFPALDAGLLSFHGAERPSRLLQALEWTGQGSVVAGDAALARWETDDGQVQTADEAAVQVEGIVRTEVGFAGAADEGPAASRIIRWQVPLRSTEPPGIGDAPLFLP
ncbi:MAG TPA: protein kinase [Pirellulales bacterium]|nr:protein kinase [Pirellulales bacterium]